MRRTTLRRRGSGRLDDLATVVLTAVRAGDVLRLELPAGPVRTFHQVGRGGLPLRTPRAGVRARHSPLGDGHASFSSNTTTMYRNGTATGRDPRRTAPSARPIEGQWSHAGDPDRARPTSRHTPDTDRRSPGCTAARWAGPARPRPAPPARGRAGRPPAG